MQAQTPREIAVRLLGPPTGGSDYVEHRLDAALARAPLSPPDRRLLQELVYGVARWRATLDWLIRRKTGGRAQPPLLANVLRLGLYQIFWLDRIPDHAAVNETVELARQLGHGPQAGFVNALLRGYAREREATRRLLAELKERQPPLGYSHPAWLCERWEKRWGAAQTWQWLEWNNTPPKTYARVNCLRVEAAQLLARWREEGVDYDFGRWDWLEENLVFELKTHPPLAQLPSFQQGWFYVQDPSTLLAVVELEIQPGQRVLDTCSAPGGKTSFIAQLLKNQGHLMAQDEDPNRLARVRDNLDRLGVTCAVTARPRKVLVPELDAPFDRILVDAPCSNTGVLRRRVELRWRLRPRDLARLHLLQIEILRQAAPRLKPGGVLVYSTCSLEPEENQQVVARFLAEHPGWQRERERELLPFKDQADGAYVARLRPPE